MHAAVLLAVALATLIVGRAEATSFTQGDILIACYNCNTIRAYDPTTLAYKGDFTHADLVNPGGMAFNARGNLVVAARDRLLEFSAPGVLHASYAKASGLNETVLFDRLGNLYLSNFTGGGNTVGQYRASDYGFQQNIVAPGSSLLGMTFDADDRLYVVSQAANRLYKFQADASFSTFTPDGNFAISGPPESLQFNRTGELLLAAQTQGIRRYNPATGTFIGNFQVSPVHGLGLVPLSIDGAGNIYAATWGNGSGTVGSYIYKLAPDGTQLASSFDAALRGPFGLVLANETLPGGPPQGAVPLPGAFTLLIAPLAILALRRRPQPSGR